MLSYEELALLKDKYIKARDRMIAQVNVSQGAIDAVTTVMAMFEQNEATQVTEAQKGDTGEASNGSS